MIGSGSLGMCVVAESDSIMSREGEEMPSGQTDKLPTRGEASYIGWSGRTSISRGLDLRVLLLRRW